MKSQELNPEPKGHNKPDRCRHFALFACVFFGWGGAVTSKDDNKTREEKKRAVWGEEWRGGSSQAVM